MKAGTVSNLSVPTEIDLRRIIQRWISLWRDCRDQYRPSSRALPESIQQRLAPFFSSRLFGQIRFTQLQGQRITLPQSEFQAFADLPPVEHQHGVMFIDTLVLNEPATERQWFHSLVHATQMDVLRLESYVDRYIRALARTHAYVKVPFEVQAFCLDTRFAASPSRCFSVAEEVRLWVSHGRY